MWRFSEINYWQACYHTCSNCVLQTLSFGKCLYTWLFVGKKFFRTSVFNTSQSKSLPLLFRLYDLSRRWSNPDTNRKQVILFYNLYSSIANAELAAHSCLLLQECIKNRSIHNYILHSYTIVEPLFTDYAYDPHFDVCSDVLQNIHLLLRDNKLLLTNDIQSDYSLFVSLFTWMRGLISCSNYITVRMSLSVWIDDFLLNRFWLRF